jgi:hypothetical protein
MRSAFRHPGYTTADAEQVIWEFYAAFASHECEDAAGSRINTVHSTSKQLERWCKRDKDSRYIPEWLLKHWRITLDPKFKS